MREWTQTIAFDEYHHFFSDRSLVDLFANPSFSVPLLGMSLLLILFFMFAHTRFHERHRESLQIPARSVHEWNEGVVSSSLTDFTRENALALHRGYLERILRHSK